MTSPSCVTLHTTTFIMFSFSARRKSLLTSLSASKWKSWNTQCEREHQLSLCRLLPSTSGWLNCRSASTISWTLMSHRDDSSAWTLKTPGCSSSSTEALRLWAVRSHKRLSGSEGSVLPSRPETCEVTVTNKRIKMRESLRDGVLQQWDNRSYYILSKVNRWYVLYDIL